MMDSSSGVDQILEHRICSNAVPAPEVSMRAAFVLVLALAAVAAVSARPPSSAGISLQKHTENARSLTRLRFRSGRIKRHVFNSN
jgi:hypothetical protein